MNFDIDIRAPSATVEPAAPNADIDATTPRPNVDVTPANANIILVPTPGLPGPRGASGAGYIHTQSTPATVVDIVHNLHRDGPILTVFYSLDYSIEWDGVVTQPLSPNVLRVSFDDPTSFIALLT